jgi:hypothetical protein
MIPATRCSELRKMAKADILNGNSLRRLYWDKRLSIPQIAGQYNLHPTSVFKRMKKYKIERRGFSESGYLANVHKPQYRLKALLTKEEEKLKIAGVMLYWAEGYKKGDGIDFVNSDPDMVKLFLRFLREVCGIGEKRLRLYLYAFESQNIGRLKQFWNKITQIPISQFSKVYVRKAGADSGKTGRRMPYGVVHIRYYDKKLLNAISGWIEDYKGSFKYKN